MENITLKEFLAYLPYGVKVILGSTRRNITAVSLDSHFIFVDDYEGSRTKQMCGIGQIKLCLRPISQITKEIEVNGDRFRPIDRIKQSHHNLFFRKDIDDALLGMALSEINKLLEWHFDIFGLIERGLALAIDLSDVDPNDLDDI